MRCGAGWTCPLVSALLLLVHCCCTVAALLLHKLEAGCAHTHMHHVASTGHPSQAPKQRLLGYSVPITPSSVLHALSLALSSSLLRITTQYLPTYVYPCPHTHTSPFLLNLSRFLVLFLSPLIISRFSFSLFNVRLSHIQRIIFAQSLHHKPHFLSPTTTGRRVFQAI